MDIYTQLRNRRAVTVTPRVRKPLLAQLMMTPHLIQATRQLKQAMWLDTPLES